MALRLLAHYFDRSEALIVHSVLDAVGIPSFVHGFDQLNMRPYYEFAFGGYRLAVADEDLATAVEVIGEARRKPLLEGERLVIRHYIAVAAMPILTFLTMGWIIYLPFRGYEWREIGGDDHASAPDALNRR